MSSPYFSIVIPMYNRERLIARAINSCLKQDYGDYEIVVVDDGSSDNSAGVVRGYSDPRIKFIGHEVNRGIGPARNTGAAAAIGEWIIFFDSDDELMPGALSTIYKRSREIGNGISRMQFMGQIDTGKLSPEPPLKDELWDYIKYIQWTETLSAQTDATVVVRRVTFEKVRFCDDRTQGDPYHLDFMKQFNAWTFPDVVACYHQDADNQLSRPEAARTMGYARDEALSGELALGRHGEARRRYAPRSYYRQISGLATLFFLSGNRLKGMKYSFMSLRHNVFSMRNWVILICGVVGPRFLTWLKCSRARR